MTVADTGLNVHLERLIDAPVEVVFANWVDPLARLEWYAPHEGWLVEARSDLRVGGAWFARFGPADGDRWTEEGEYTVVDPPHRVSYTTKFSHPNGEFFWTLTTITLTDAGGGKTLLRLDDNGFPNETERAAHEGGWPDFVDSFTRYVTAL